MEVCYFSEFPIDEYVFHFESYKNEKYAVYYFRTSTKYITYSIFNGSYDLDKGEYVGMIIDSKNEKLPIDKSYFFLEFYVPKEFNMEYTYTLEALKYEYFLFIHPISWDEIETIPLELKKNEISENDK